uniref:Uncharacterized protein n=1 Tax=Leersia perrieri TaxID=77586 RepID=A0A0G2KBI4_9ORYZ
MNSASEQRSF